MLHKCNLKMVQIFICRLYHVKRFFIGSASINYKPCADCLTVNKVFNNIHCFVIIFTFIHFIIQQNGKKTTKSQSNSIWCELILKNISQVVVLRNRSDWVSFFNSSDAHFSYSVAHQIETNWIELNLCWLSKQCCHLQTKKKFLRKAESEKKCF